MSAFRGSFDIADERLDQPPARWPTAAVALSSVPAASSAIGTTIAFDRIRSVPADNEDRGRETAAAHTTGSPRSGSMINPNDPSVPIGGCHHREAVCRVLRAPWRADVR